uniref:Uncharacterized protein n=1 Tax=Micromonas pusilla TaxID=38833 RepID=A0A7S0PP68_MICPS
MASPATTPRDKQPSSRMKIGPVVLSADSKTAICGVKLTRGLEYKPWNAQLNLGAFVDLGANTVSGFSRLEVDAGKVGKVVADVEGVEVQKDWHLPWEWAEGRLELSAGIGLQRETRGGPDFKPRPYLNVDFRPAETPFRAAMVSWSLVKDQPIEMRPKYDVSPNVSVEFPLTLTGHVFTAKDPQTGRDVRTPRGSNAKEDGCLKLHAHGAVVSYKFGVTSVDELKWDVWRRNMSAAEREAERNKSKEQRDAEKAARRAREQAEKAKRDAAKARKEADAKVKKAKEEADARVKKEKEAKAKRAKEVKSQRG